ncbi:hypothetical protein R1flu_014642 [Riccia fluitans]|uniref:Uncharacterized protein n=1 Tax=Riccia fluitans TaxID=41844 RepID=A0ABD1YGP1_9MARC
MVDEAAGQRLPTIRLMDEELYNVSTTEQIQKFCSRIQFVPYSFKEMKDLDLVKILAMYFLNMLKYVASLQRHYVLEDIFLWDLQNMDAEGDHLLVKDARASVEHNPNKKLVSGQPYEEVLYYKDAAPYGPTYHLMTTVAELFWSARRSNRFLTPMILAYLRGLHGHGYNWAKAILHGLRNKIHFLQSRARNNEGGKPILVVWTPCFVHILFGLRHNLFAGTPLEEVEGWVGWTHVTKDTDMTLPQLHSKFPKLITSLSDLRQRCQLPEEIPIASPEQAGSTRRPRVEDKQPEEIVPAILEQPVSSQRPEDIPIALPELPVSSKRPRAEDKERGFPSKKKNKLPSTEKQSAKELSAAIRQDISQVINSRLLPYVQARIQRHIAAIDTWKKAYEVELSKVRELQATNDGLREQLAAKDAAKSEVHALARTEVQHELEEFKRSMNELEDFKRSMTTKEKAAEETHLQKLALVQTELEETKWSSEASIKRLEEEASRLREALAAKESAVQALENAHHKEISTLKATCRKYKTSLDGEIGTNADL